VRFLGRGSNPPPPARESGSAVSSPAGFGAEHPPPKGFLLSPALMMASPDTIILRPARNVCVSPSAFFIVLVNEINGDVDGKLIGSHRWPIDMCQFQ